MAENIITVTDASFDEIILTSNIPFLVDFWAAWCAPCRMIAPIVEELANEYQGKIKVGKMNVDENRKTPIKYGILSIPTLMIFKDGKMVENLVGVPPNAKVVLKSKIDSVL